MAVTRLNDLNFFEKVYTNKTKAIVLFSGEFSKASEAVEFYMDRIPKDSLSGFDLLACNVDLSLTVRKNEKIEHIPTFKFYNNGQEIRRVTGFLSPRELVEEIARIDQEIKNKSQDSLSATKKNGANE